MHSLAGLLIKSTYRSNSGEKLKKYRADCKFPRGGQKYSCLVLLLASGMQRSTHLHSIFSLCIFLVLDVECPMMPSVP